MNEGCSDNVASALTGARRPWSPHELNIPELTPDSGSSHGFSCLNEVDLFADLTAAEIQAMDRAVPARMFRRGGLVFSQTQPAMALFILKSGRLRVFRVARDDKALTVAVLEPGAVFGEMKLVGQRMYDYYAEALEDSAIRQFDSVDVEHFLLSDPRIAIRISRLLGEQVARLEERLSDAALRPLTARLASTLLTLAESAPSRRFGQDRHFRLTEEQIARLLGSTREATSRILADMSGRGIIRQRRGRISLKNTAALRTMARSTQ